MRVDIMFRRQIAWRVFIEEIRRSKQIHEEEMDGKIVRYLVSPFGALINRIYMVGTVTDIVESSEKKTIKARVSDITGVTSIYASEFQPDVYTFLKLIGDEPTIIMFTAKIRVFEPEEGRKIPLIRPERIKRGTLNDRNIWIVDAASNVIERMEYMEKVIGKFDGELTEDMLIELGIPPHYWRPIRISLMYYTPEEILDQIRDYKSLLSDSLGYVSDVIREEYVEEEAEEIEEEIPEYFEEEEEESPIVRAILEAIRELDKGSGAPWSEVVERVHGLTKVSREIIEEVIEDLLTNTRIYEVARGKLKLLG